MISQNFDFSELLNELKGKSRNEVWELLNREFSLAEIPLIDQPRRDYDRKIYANLLGKMLFFLRNECRPADLRPEKFALFRPLCEDWVRIGEMEPVVLELFDKKK
jgi:hypothetical protein